MDTPSVSHETLPHLAETLLDRNVEVARQLDYWTRHYEARVYLDYDEITLRDLLTSWSYRTRRWLFEILWKPSGGRYVDWPERLPSICK